jgi:Sulfite exporter TauE/SafE
MILTLVALLLFILLESFSIDDEKDNVVSIEWKEIANDMTNRNETSKEGGHFNDPLFHTDTLPLFRLAVISTLCWLITSCAVAAGIGGGGLLVPLYAMGLGVGTKLAVPISTATIFGVALGNASFLVTERHPHANRPLIDYATVSFMQPGELMGVVLGVMLNRFFPEVIIILLMVLVLSMTAFKTFEKGNARWKAETQARILESNLVLPLSQDTEGSNSPNNQNDENGKSDNHDDIVEAEATRSPNHSILKFSKSDILDTSEVEYSTLDPTDDGDDDDHRNIDTNGNFISERSLELIELHELEARQFPIEIYLILVAMTCFLILYSLLHFIGHHTFLLF